MDLLIADLFLYILIEQTGTKTRIFRLLKDQTGGGLDRQLVEFLRRRPVIQAADRLGRDAKRIDARQIYAAAGDRAYDLINIYRFERAISFADLHR